MKVIPRFGNEEKLINISEFLLLLILNRNTIRSMRYCALMSVIENELQVALDLGYFGTNNRNFFDLSFQATCCKMWTSGKYLLIVFVISFKSEFFQFIFDIFERNITEIRASFKGNVALCFACMGVVQCFFPFTDASAVTHSLQCATVCLTTFVLLCYW